SGARRPGLRQPDAGRRYQCDDDARHESVRPAALPQSHGRAQPPVPPFATCAVRTAETAVLPALSTATTRQSYAPGATLVGPNGVVNGAAVTVAIAVQAVVPAGDSSNRTEAIERPRIAEALACSGTIPLSDDPGLTNVTLGVSVTKARRVGQRARERARTS